MNVTGDWKGEYHFEEIEDADDEGQASKKAAGTVVTFTMKLKQGWLGMVSGTAQDDTRTGFAEPGAIKGRVKGSVLGFRKTHPTFRLIHESSRLTLEQWADRHKVVMSTSRPHPAILFMGDISEDGKTIEGRWRMPGSSLEIPGSYQQLQLPTLGGSFKLTRQ